MNPLVRTIMLWTCVISVLLAQVVLAVDLGPFQAGCPTVDPTLERVKFKSVVMQFLDPHNSGTGHAIGRILWREIREATLSVKDSGTIFVHDRDKLLLKEAQGKEYMQYLNTGYHD